ncbi:EpsI family protein [bacterium]|nr:EpsI family protein [bacterium]
MKINHNLFQNIWVNVFVLMALFIGAYWIPLKGIVNVWITNDDYSYGFLIPVVSAYLFWDMRSRLNDLKIKNAWIVLPVLLLFVLISIYGILGSSGNVSRPAIPVLIILFTGFCFGIKTVKRFALPLCFLIFAVPLPPVLDRTFGVFLKSVSSKLGGLLIQLCDIPVHVSGNVIDLGVTQLQVVDACSGLRFIFPLFALGVVYAYFFERVTWKRIFCVFFTIPIAILTNGLRIGITGVLANSYGAGVAEGFFHDFSGWAIFMAAFVFLFLVGRFLRLFPPKNHVQRVVESSEATQKNNSTTIHGRNGAFVVSILLLLIVGGLTWNTKILPPVQIHGGIKSFPLAFADWKGAPQQVDPDIIIRSGAEQAFSGLYINSKNEAVSLYIGYRATAFLENENFFHSPTVCLPGSGWKIKETSTHKIANVPFFQDLTITKMVMEEPGTKQLVYFWFQTKNKATHDKDINRFHLALHAIRMDNTHDLFIRPITYIKPDETIKDAEERMDRFVREMMRALLHFLSEKQEKANISATG